MAVALVQASRWGVLVGLAALPAPETESGAEAETEPPTRVVVDDVDRRVVEPQLEDPVELQSIVTLSRRPGQENEAADTSTSAAPDDRRPGRRLRRSIADEASDDSGYLTSDPVGVPFQSLTASRPNLSVTVWPSTQWSSTTNTSVQAEVLITTPTGFVEKFFVQIPTPLPATPQPLLVVFHKFGSTHLDVIQHTEFAEEANNRGWFLVSPIGASKKHFASLESQVNTEWVFQWLLAGYGARIDSQRIYGVGFSMGGGAVTNYAARHLDPAKPMFAAVVNHSGGVALKNTYYHEINVVRDIFDFWFGDGTAGSADSWKMLRSSVIDFDPVTLVTATDNDLARNLMHIPLQIKRAEIDAIHYVNDQTDALHQHMLNLGKVVGPDYSYEFLPNGSQGYGHSWEMLDFTEVCDWLSRYSLQIPTAANTLADHDGVYFHFMIEQDAAGAFTPFSWSVDSVNNALVIENTANLARVTVPAQDAGLNPAQGFSITMGTQDGLPDEIVLTQVPSLPTEVLRDASAAVTWNYNPLSQTLTITETDGGAHAWEILP